MKPDKLEQFVLDNKKEFGAPTPDVWSKIEKRQPKKKGRVISLQFVLSRAAAVIVIFFSSYYVHDYRAKQKAQTNVEIVAETNTEYNQLKEAQLYYVSEIHDKSREFYSLTTNSPSVQADIKRDLSELDAIFLELKKDLNDNANNQEVIEAMIMNYMLKLEILEDMLEQIKPTQNNNNDYDKVYSI